MLLSAFSSFSAFLNFLGLHFLTESIRNNIAFVCCFMGIAAWIKTNEWMNISVIQVQLYYTYDIRKRLEAEI